jgi:nucleoside-diphosphate-sugar epimerase
MLVTGSASGLGKYLCNYFKVQGLCRKTPWELIEREAQIQAFPIIVHAAFNTQRDINSANLASYLQDNLLLTQKLLQLPHKKFIFISTCDVYPKNNSVHKEDEIIDLQKIDNLYALSKLMCEALVQQMSDDYLILRPTALLGQTAKKNSLMKILFDEEVKLSLAAQASFNYVLHQDIAKIIELAQTQTLNGIFNVAASENITLQTIVESFNVKKMPKFGQYAYQTGMIDNGKICQYLPALSRSSLESVRLFLQDYLHVQFA